MLQRIRHNMRYVAWAIVLLILGTTAGAGGAWRCADGNLCPFGGRMAQSSVARNAAPAACPMCRVVASNPSHGERALRAAGMHCFIASADHQVATSSAPAQLAAPALLAASVAPFTVQAASHCWLPAPNAHAPPDPGLSAHSGRAPPAFA